MHVDRRTVARGAAWTAPAIVIAAAAPSLAASTAPPRKDPGINGWVLNTPQAQRGCAHTIEVDSTLTGSGTDGAPFGLYLYDITPQTIVSNAQLTYWIIGTQQATWTNLSGHSSCWSQPAQGAAQTKSDGYVYTPYTFTYTCPLYASDISSDGRLRLGGFHVRAAFTQTQTYCSNVTYWTQRSVVVDPDGSGPRASQTLTFERRNGTLGPASSVGARAMAARSVGSVGLPS